MIDESFFPNLRARRSLARLAHLTLLAGLLAVTASVASGATITVTTAADDLTPNDGSVSLREAITAINFGNDLGDPDITAQNPGTFGTNDRINFNIAGAGVHTIMPTTSLPTITDPVVIDAYTQPGASANTLAVGDNAVLLIELDGANAGSANGLTITAGNSTVRGLVINRFQSDGININNGNGGNVIAGNFIGTDATGANSLGNSVNGIVSTSGVGGNLIGGATAAARNLISGNGNSGAQLQDNSGDMLQGNFIGTDVTGTKPLGNAVDGLNLRFGPGGNTILVNVISANKRAGIVVESSESNNVVQGNFIGTDVTGTLTLGNADRGIVITDANHTTIQGNIIAHNALDGIGVRDNVSTSNQLLGNSIFGNAGLGIDLLLDGVTPNDDGDTDDGPNHLQNFPVLQSVTNGGGMTTITGRLNSAASTTYRIEFFANDSIDSSGYGEGQIFLGFKNATTNGSGNITFSQSFPQIGAAQRVTATATDPNNNTSEFSGAIGQLLNISTRMEVLTGNSVLIGGFIIGGSGNKQVLLRALGPTLTQFGVTGVLADPTLELHDGSGALITSNDNWKDTQQAAIAATGKAPPNDLESAILHSFTPGNYTAIVRGKNNTTGIGLVEAYDIDEAITPTLTNISTRGFVDTGQNVMIGGFISGNGIVRVIVRALGPTLTQFGVPSVLADLTLEIHDVNGTLIVSNDNWQDSQQAEIQASGFAPPNTNESAIIIVRPATNTTAIVRGKNNTTGNALVEAYILPP